MKILDDQFVKIHPAWAQLGMVIAKANQSMPHAKRIVIKQQCPSCGVLTNSHYECAKCQLMADRMEDR